jgi:ATP-dependent Clp protease adaptor protein ClpS
MKTNRMGEPERHTGEEVLERTRQETKKPELFKVLLLNDDYTTMDFVVEILESVFNKAPAEAYRIMMAVHTQGQGLCGVYPYEVAETKVATVVDMARSHGFPLRAAMEPE